VTGDVRRPSPSGRCCCSRRSGSHGLALSSSAVAGLVFFFLTTCRPGLAIARTGAYALVTILPARCYVGTKWTLTVALHESRYRTDFPRARILTARDCRQDTIRREHICCWARPMGANRVNVGRRARPWNGVPGTLSDGRRRLRHLISPPSTLALLRANTAAVIISFLEHLTRSITARGSKTHIPAEPGARGRLAPCATKVPEPSAVDPATGPACGALRVDGLIAARIDTTRYVATSNHSHACRLSHAFESSPLNTCMPLQPRSPLSRGRPRLGHNED